MAWIESHQSLGSHLKLRRLARKLGIHRAQAIGHLHYLWWWALDNAPTGDVSGLTPAELAEVAEWNGEDAAFDSALRSCGWVDPDGRLHDWQQYAGRLINARQWDAERKRKSRRFSGHPPDQSEDRPPDVHRTSDGHPTDIRGTVTAPNPTQPNPTQPNLSRENTASVGRENPNGACSRKPSSLKECLAVADMIGLPAADAEAWHRDMEVAGWTRANGDPFASWRREMQYHRDRLRQQDYLNRQKARVPDQPKAKTFTKQTLADAQRDLRALGIE